MKASKQKPQEKGLTDKQLVEKYEAGSIKLTKLIKDTFVTDKATDRITPSSKKGKY